MPADQNHCSSLEIATAWHKSCPSLSRSRCAAGNTHPPDFASARMSPARPLAERTVRSLPPDSRSSAPDSLPAQPAAGPRTAQTISPPSDAAFPSGRQSAPDLLASDLSYWCALRNGRKKNVRLAQFLQNTCWVTLPYYEPKAKFM